MNWDQVVSRPPRKLTILESQNYVVTGGSYSGMNLIAIYRANPGYVFWLSQKGLGKLSDAAKQYLDWMDCE